MNPKDHVSRSEVLNAKGQEAIGIAYRKKSPLPCQFSEDSGLTETIPLTVASLQPD